jgi:DNA-binding transcriptional LysR family regulator
VLSRLAVEDALRRGDLVVVETPDYRPTRTLWGVRHREKRVTSLMRALLELMGDPQFRSAAAAEDAGAG